MPRKRREESLTRLYDWIMRGMNKRILFHDPKECHFFLRLILEHEQKFSVLIYHYCLMTHHVHILMYVEEFKNLAEFSHDVERRYVNRFGSPGDLI